jgi:hypothetical protein
MSDTFDDDLAAALKAADDALNKGPYKKAMRDLLALSMEEIKSAIPTVKYSDYSKLMTVVEQASAANIAQASLGEKITDLGSVAVKIAKMVPSLAALF